jgi:hypothetical protein
MLDKQELEEVYARMPSSNVSNDVLEHLPDHLRIVPLPDAAGWSDVGTPERLADVGWETNQPTT